MSRFATRHYAKMARWLGETNAPPAVIDRFATELYADNRRFKPEMFEAAVRVWRHRAPDPGTTNRKES